MDVPGPGITGFVCHDIIGDSHGCNPTLLALLEKLGYTRCDGGYRHAGRRVIFLGHYRTEGEPVPLADNIACLDYGVAKQGGKLVT